MNRSLGILLVVCCFFTGCITTWVKSTGTVLNKGYRYGFKINTPKGWYTRQINRIMLYSQHGLFLEYILLDSKKWKDTLSNGYRIPSKILLHEIPTIILADLCAQSYAYNMQVQENEIVFIDSFPCTLTKFTFSASNSLEMRGIMYCIPFKKFLTVLSYTAEKSVYYEKAYKDFMDMIPSIIIRDRKYLYLHGIKAEFM